MKIKTSYIFILYFLIIAISTSAQNNNEAKQWVLDCKNNMSLKNMKASVDINVTDKKGHSSFKSMNLTFGNYSDVKKILIELTAPENIKGMKISLFDTSLDKNEVQIYLPSSGKVRTLNVKAKRFKIPGSEFSLDYFKSAIESGTTFSLKEDVVFNNQKCKTVLIKHNDIDDYELLYISQNTKELLKINSFNSKNEKEYEALFSDYKNIEGSDSNIFPGKIAVTNLLTNQNSVLTVKNIESVPNPDRSLFDLSYLNKKI